MTTIFSEVRTNRERQSEDRDVEGGARCMSRTAQTGEPPKNVESTTPGTCVTKDEATLRHRILLSNRLIDFHKGRVSSARANQAVGGSSLPCWIRREQRIC